MTDVQVKTVLAVSPHFAPLPAESSDNLTFFLGGKTIAGAEKGQDASGYNCLILSFADGSQLRVREEGMTGHFSTMFANARA